MSKKHREQTTAEFQSYLDTELLIGLSDREKSTTFTERTVKLDKEFEETRAQRQRLLYHKKQVATLAETLHTNNEDL